MNTKWSSIKNGLLLSGKWVVLFVLFVVCGGCARQEVSYSKVLSSKAENIHTYLSRGDTLWFMSAKLTEADYWAYVEEQGLTPLQDYPEGRMEIVNTPGGLSYISFWMPTEGPNMEEWVFGNPLTGSSDWGPDFKKYSWWAVKNKDLLPTNQPCCKVWGDSQRRWMQLTIYKDGVIYQKDQYQKSLYGFR